MNHSKKSFFTLIKARKNSSSVDLMKRIEERGEQIKEAEK